MSQKIRAHKGILILIILGFIFHSLLALVPPLNGDEAFFWEWSRHLDFGYYSHPPMTAWLIALITGLTGTSQYTLRLTSILLHLGTIFIVYLLAWEITNKKRTALTAAVIYCLLPLSLALGTMITTDCPLIFFYALSAYFVKKAIIDEKKRFWYWAGISCGGMLLSKFMAVLFLPPLLLFLLFSAEYRKHLAAKEPYLAFLLSMAVFSPFIYWNINNKWLTFQFNFLIRHEDKGLGWLKPVQYITGQMLAASPVIFVVMIIALMFFLTKLFFNPKSPKTAGRFRGSILLLSFLTAFPLIYYLILSLNIKVGAHWAAIIYPLSSILAAVWLYGEEKEIFADSGGKIKTLAVSIFSQSLILAFLTVALIFPTILPDRLLYTKAVKEEAPPVSHYFGWREAGQYIAEKTESWNSKSPNFFFSAKDYAFASVLAFYVPGKPQFFLMNYPQKGIHGKEFLIWAKGRKKIGDNTIYVSDTPFSHQGKIIPFFEKTVELEPLVVKDKKGRILRVFYFTAGYSYKGGEPDSLSLW